MGTLLWWLWQWYQYGMQQASEVAIVGLHCEGRNVVATVACGSCHRWTRGVVVLRWGLCPPKGLHLGGSVTTV